MQGTYEVSQPTGNPGTRQCWVDVAGFNMHENGYLWKAPTYLLGHHGAEPSWNEEGNWNLLKFDLSAADFKD